MAAACNSNMETTQNPQLTSEKHMPVAAVDKSYTEDVEKRHLIYRCKKCRRIVAAQENLVTHEPGKGESSFKWQKRSGDVLKKEKKLVECTSIFVEPMKWMEPGDFNRFSYYLYFFFIHIWDKMLNVGL